MSKEFKYNRRRFLGSAALTLAASDLALTAFSTAKSFNTKLVDTTSTKNMSNNSFETIKQINAGVLNIGYAETGAEKRPAVILLHGWPYDIHSFVDVAPFLASAGYRVIIPHLRGYGTTKFL